MVSIHTVRVLIDSNLDVITRAANESHHKFNNFSLVFSFHMLRSSDHNKTNLAVWVLVQNQFQRNDGFIKIPFELYDVPCFIKANKMFGL